MRHEVKGDWDGSQLVEHLGFHVYSALMRFFDTRKKSERLRLMALQIMTEVRMGRQRVSTAALWSFCSTFVSMSL